MSSVTVRLLPLPHLGDVALPELATEEAAGADLRACIAGPVTIAPGERRLVKTGFAMALPPGWEAQVRPRSGLALRYGVTVLNSPGTIDSDYRGEVGVVLVNHGAEPFTVERGDRIAQMVIAELPSVRFEVVGGLDGTARGEGGYGSTGRS